VRELGLALGRWHSELEPWFLLNRDLPIPPLVTEAFMRYGRVVCSDDSDLPRDAIYHSPSPFEPSPLDRLWPPSLRRLPLVVTLHDLIPAVFTIQQRSSSAARHMRPDFLHSSQAPSLRACRHFSSVSPSATTSTSRMWPWSNMSQPTQSCAARSASLTGAPTRHSERGGCVGTDHSRSTLRRDPCAEVVVR
jgi:hypothetical protein